MAALALCSFHSTDLELGVRDSFLHIRVIREQASQQVRVLALNSLQLLKHRNHCLWIETGARHATYAEKVRLAFLVARVIGQQSLAHVLAERNAEIAAYIAGYASHIADLFRDLVVLLFLPERFEAMTRDD